MKNIAIISNKSRDRDYRVTRDVYSRLSELGLKCRLDLWASESILGSSGFETLPEDTDLVIVVGGDGSMLDASVQAIPLGIPMLGVNLGKVGYLSEVDPEKLSMLSGLVSGDYVIEEKMLLSAAVCHGGRIEKIDRYAVNDVVISHESFLGLAELLVEDAEKNALSYRADGLIVATPQGSTAYSLSSGGPIVAHDVDGIILTPVSPHSFFNRSVIFNSGDELSVTNTGKSEVNVSIDGRLCARLAVMDTCVIRRAEKRVKVLTFSKNSMFTNLFKKMRILEDID